MTKPLCIVIGVGPGNGASGGKAAVGRIADYHSGHTVPAIPVGNLTPRGYTPSHLPRP